MLWVCMLNENDWVLIGKSGLQFSWEIFVTYECMQISKMGYGWLAVKESNKAS